MAPLTLPESLSLIAAPMVNQSDLPFRLLTRKHGATMAYTQMLSPDRLINDQDYLEFHRRDLEHSSYSDLGRPVVVQLCGNDADGIVKAGRLVEGLCDGIDLNLGCPQEHARDGHYGAYLLGQKDWSLVEQIVSSMSRSLSIPISTKLRLCTPTSQTPVLASRLAAQGASWITLHARHVSARRRRVGAADLSVVKALSEQGLDIPVVSNGNVRTWEDIKRNREETGADGIMVGETLLANPCIFENRVPDPVLISLEYLDICKSYPETATIPTIRTHVRHFVEFKCSRRPWYNKFRACLNSCETIEEIEILLRTKVTRWRGKAAGVEGVKSVRSKLDSDDEGSEGGKQDVDDDLFLIV